MTKIIDGRTSDQLCTFRRRNSEDRRMLSDNSLPNTMSTPSGNLFIHFTIQKLRFCGCQLVVKEMSTFLPITLFLYHLNVDNLINVTCSSVSFFFKFYVTFHTRYSRYIRFLCNIKMSSFTFPWSVFKNFHNLFTITN
jgi:hypothetical protein